LLNRTNATQNAMTIQRGGVEHPHPDRPRALISYTVELFFFVPPFLFLPFMSRSCRADVSTLKQAAKFRVSFVYYSFSGAESMNPACLETSHLI